MRVTYLFTTFPLRSETFLQREVRAMRERADVRFDLHSIWGGAAEWEGLPVRRFPFAAVARVILWQLPKWCWRRPDAITEVWGEYLRGEPRGLLDLGENLLGLAYALDTADDFRADPPDLIHGVWTSMPGAAALLLERLTGVPYSLGAHAYDIFSRGGDWLAKTKLRRARFVHNSTSAARARALALGCPPARAALIRRGLDTLPPPRPDAPPPARLTLLSVGRLVPKKGFSRLLLILRALADAGVDYRAVIVGEGELAGPLAVKIRRLALEDRVTLAGALDYDAVSRLHDAADIFLFTGVVAPNGDRDGLPNVIGEAMAHGAGVITSPVSGTTEAIADGVTGQVAPIDDTAAWVRAVKRLRDDPEFVRRTREAARAWVEEHFCAHANAAHLAARFHAAAAEPPRRVIAHPSRAV